MEKKLKTLLFCLSVGFIFYWHCVPVEAAASVSIGFLEQDAGMDKLGLDETDKKGIFFILKNYAYKVKKAEIDYDSVKRNNTYQVEMNLRQYEPVRKWNKPHMKAEYELVDESVHDIVDSYGNFHTIRTKKYDTIIKDYLGNWEYSGRVDVSLYLYDISNGKHELVLEHTAKRSSFDEIEAFKEVTREFYVKVKELLKNKNKALYRKS